MPRHPTQPPFFIRVIECTQHPEHTFRAAPFLFTFNPARTPTTIRRYHQLAPLKNQWSLWKFAPPSDSKFFSSVHVSGIRMNTLSGYHEPLTSGGADVLRRITISSIYTGNRSTWKEIFAKAWADISTFKCKHIMFLSLILYSLYQDLLSVQL